MFTLAYNALFLNSTQSFWALMGLGREVGEGLLAPKGLTTSWE